jgi:Protein of unknown function (DUF3489)
MTELSEAQRVILTTAAKRKDGLVLPVTSKLKGGALKKVLSALLARGSIEETPASPSQQVWRTSDGGVALTLKLTKTDREGVAGRRKASARTETKPDAAARSDTKQAKVIAMLKRPGGATVDQIVKATGWQPHTVRGFFAGALKQRLGIDVASEKTDGGNRIYRIAG